MAIRLPATSNQNILASVAGLTAAPVTQCYWFKTASISDFRICGLGNASNDEGLGRSILRGTNPHMEIVQIDDGSAASRTVNTPNNSLTTNTWHHIAEVHTAATDTAYADGVAGTPSSSTFGAFPTLSQFRAGGFPEGAGFSGDFEIAHIAIFAGELSAGDVADLAAGVNPADFPNLIDYWELDGSLTNVIGGRADFTASGTFPSGDYDYTAGPTIDDPEPDVTDLTPVGVTSSAVVGTPVLSRQLAPTGVTSSAVVGTPLLGPRNVVVTDQAGGSGTAEVDISATGGVNRVLATLVDAGTGVTITSKREDVDPSDTVGFTGVSAGSRRIGVRDILKATVSGITVAAAMAFTPVGVTSSATVGTPVLGDGSTPDQTMTVAIEDMLAGGARTNVPFMFGVPLETSFVGGTDSSGNTLSATVGGSPQNIGVAMRCADQGGKLAYAVVGGVLASLSSGGSQDIVVSTASGSDPSGTGITWANVLAAVNDSAATWNTTVEIVVSGTTYIADPRTVATSDTTFAAANPFYQGQFIDTPYFAGFTFSVPFEDGSGNRAHDKLRCQFEIYAWKAGSGAVGGGNPIIAIMAEPVIKLGNWGGSSWTPPTASSITVKDYAGSTVDSWTATIPLRGYTADDMQLNGVWWSNVAATNRGGWEAVHENASGVLQKFKDNGWLPVSFLESADVSSKLAAHKSTMDGLSQDPFAFYGRHAPSQPDTGARPDINLTHEVEFLAHAMWDDATVRETVRRNFSGALAQPLQLEASGLILDVDGAHDSVTTETLPAATPAPLIVWDRAHHPLDGFLLYLTTGRLKYLRHMQQVVVRALIEEAFGTGWNRRHIITTQARGGAWALRTLAIALACTPNGLGGTATGMTRADLQAGLDAGAGEAGDVNSFGLYHGTENAMWDASQAGAIPASGLFDNDQAGNARWVPMGGTTLPQSFQLYFYIMAAAQASRLGVLNSDGIAMRDWVFEMGKRLWDTKVMDEYYFGRNYNARVDPPKTWTALLHDWNSDSKQAGPAEDFFIVGASLAGCTGFTIDASTPSAVTVTLNGSGLVAYFDDDEQNHGGARGDWFKNAANGYTGGAAWVCGTAPNNWSGRVTGVSSDGLTVTIDCTVATGVTPSSSGAQSDESALRLPIPGPNSAWLTGNQIVYDGSNDYTDSGRAAAELIAATDGSVDMDDIRARLTARLALRSSSDIVLWGYGERP